MVHGAYLTSWLRAHVPRARMSLAALGIAGCYFITNTKDIEGGESTGGHGGDAGGSTDASSHGGGGGASAGSSVGASTGGAGPSSSVSAHTVGAYVSSSVGANTGGFGNVSSVGSGGAVDPSCEVELLMAMLDSLCAK